jgi:hypothetical protein
MNGLGSLFRIENIAEMALIGFAVISFRSRAVVFCQYLQAMTGVKLSAQRVKQVFRASGKNGVREMMLDLLIRQDFAEQGPVAIPESTPPKRPVEGETV